MAGSNRLDAVISRDAIGQSRQIRHVTLKQDMCRRFPLLVGSRVTLEADLNGRDWLETLQAAGFDPQVSTAAADAITPLQVVPLPPCIGTRSKQIHTGVSHDGQAAAARPGILQRRPDKQHPLEAAAASQLTDSGCTCSAVSNGVDCRGAADVPAARRGRPAAGDHRRSAFWLHWIWHVVL